MTTHPKIQPQSVKGADDGPTLSLILAHGLSSSSLAPPRPASPSPALTPQTTWKAPTGSSEDQRQALILSYF